MAQRILVIDDDTKLTKLLKEYLGSFGFEVEFVTSGEAGLKCLANNHFHLILLDLMLPGMSGLEVCKEIRILSSIPIIMLTAKGELPDKVLGLELGADDYLPKPFEPRELVARVQTILRRTQHIESQKHILKADNLRLNLHRLTAELSAVNIPLTPHEVHLLEFLMKSYPKVVTRDEIMDHLSGIENSAFDRSIDIAISRIRQKLGDQTKNPKWIKTIWGEGYLFLKKVEYG